VRTLRPCRKKTGSAAENFKKNRIDSWEFRKKTGSAAENFKKRSDRFLRIPEKDRLGS
jgi:predicted DNA binding CopG/RHH family protein